MRAKRFTKPCPECKGSHLILTPTDRGLRYALCGRCGGTGHVLRRFPRLRTWWYYRSGVRRRIIGLKTPQKLLDAVTRY